MMQYSHTGKAEHPNQRKRYDFGMFRLVQAQRYYQ
jgi:hypothetical protein